MNLQPQVDREKLHSFSFEEYVIITRNFLRKPSSRDLLIPIRDGFGKQPIIIERGICTSPRDNTLISA